MRSLYKIAMFSLLVPVLFSSCLKSNVEEDNDNEVITTLELHFTPSIGGSEIVYKFDDPDGPGGNAATQDAITLAPNRTYNVRVVLLDKTKNPVDNITEEVAEEAIDHRFYYTPAANSNVTVTDLDNDSNGIPVGINSKWTTGAAASGSITVTLRHYENGGKALADLVNSTKSSTDAEVVFVTKIQ